MKAILAFLAIAILSTPAAAVQTSSRCDNTGKYCFGGALYDCADGVPQVVEYCRYSCREAACTQDYIEPGVTYNLPEQPPVESSDTPLFLVVILASAGIIVLYIATKRRK